MKPTGAVVILCLASLLAAQQTRREATSYSYDADGRRVEGTRLDVVQTPGSVQTTQRVRSLNGREVPIESVEERVVSQDGGTRIVERVVRKYDADGRPGPPEKLRVEERRSADGSSTTQTTVYRSDINGHYQLAERSVQEMRKAGDTTTASKSVQRPTLNGDLEVVEKSSRSARETGTQEHQDTVVYRKSTSGEFFPALREITERAKTGQGITETTTAYEGSSPGQMQFARQTVSREHVAPDGSVQREVDLYSVVTPGRSTTAGEVQPQLRERQTYQRRPGPGDSVVESLSVSRPSLADPDRLGRPRKISEVVCRGNCSPATPSATQPEKKP